MAEIPTVPEPLQQAMEKAAGPSASASAQGFPQILTAELDAVDEGRSLRAGRRTEESVGATGRPPEKTTWERAVRRAHESRLAALAFSGGGIRSATFNLGIAQGLARLRLLKRFDYLSTNSGGGYIGSWLTAWIRRAGIEAVEEQLDRGPRAAEADPLRGEGGGEGEAAKTPGAATGWLEPEPLVWLRRFSNYLTPRVGIFTADSWTMVATYLRNLLLNLTILVTALAAMLLVPRAVVFVSAWLQPKSALWLGAIASLVAGILFVACNLWVPWRDPCSNPQPTGTAAEDPRGDREEPSYPWFTGQAWVQILVVIPLYLAAWLASTWMGTAKATTVSPLMSELGMADWPVPMRWGGLALVLYLVAWLLGLLVHVLFTRWQERRASEPGGGRKAGERAGGSAARRSRLERGQLGLWLIVAAVLSGMVGGLLLWTVSRFWLSSPETLAAGGPVLRSPLHITIWGPPLIVGVFILTAVIHVGLMGRPFQERYRQWWSRLGAWLLIYSLAWLALFSIAFYGPLLILWLGGWARMTLSLGWSVITAGGVWVGRRTTAATEAPRPWRRWVIELAPPIFIAGLLLLLALGLHATLLGVTADSAPLADGELWPSSEKSLSEIGHIHTAAMWASILGLGGWNLGLPILLLASALLLSHQVDINQFSMHLFYRNRLIRAYLGASNPDRRPQPFTGFAPGDDLALARLSPRVEWRGRAYDGPYPILNAALNLVSGRELAWQERRATSFIFSPLHSGYSPRLAGGTEDGGRLEPFGYRPTAGYKGRLGGLSLGTAMAISGAAVSPNMGYQTTPAMAFLLTVFNVRLGWWLGNPRRSDTWRRTGPYLGAFTLLAELFGKTDDESRFVHLTDGGHFDNLALYELVRRRCRWIVATDAGADPEMTFQDLGNTVRKCRTDFGIDIEIDTGPLDRRAAGGSGRHWAVGRIRYDRVDPGAAPGTLIYLKASLTGDEPRDVSSYAAANPGFPHQSTGDQWFDESQFESYRKLGLHIAESVFAAAANRPAGEGSEELFEAVLEGAREPSAELRREAGSGEETGGPGNPR